ncbi:ergothioneine biosynthesis protein EgtB [Pandoraea apista]|uniref:Ergothioneine biosynthesis protein EgtB n=1 Tax=Pandoraea apista TaxID=93218 RepID=A0ABX9ZSP2_9BURK|nr:ergothioneine biosynthesis protein EgtB [Pandoraea apista]PTE01369.1 ergothioneine biosynthesis protein EgtB [Pandoraea apista]RRJ31721.1 ergothioneine biosynthesis protein EgtB [Pandoraea apista]RRJ73392.1 ergothioneine biosynthesis protein EgtB [Pandoraea apista]RSD12558.1 ergothioneine biosynthesis protein EgtB [Pandoraea apista]RSD22627.1 ergothioneine biosynthesis protein EgtB [Pandoraea apista]
MTLPCCTSQAEAPSGTSQNTPRSRTARDGPPPHVPAAPQALPARYDTVRAASVAFAQGLSDADATVQSMPDASPIKWHLAHTTWFFETFLLGESGALSGRRYRPFDPRFAYLFNSYYEAAGPRHPRPQRGLLTRPTLDDVLRYRQHVDAAMHECLLHADLPADVHALVTLGLHHEEQHQELMHTDLLHLFAQNPLRPAHRRAPPSSAREIAVPLHWIAHDGGQHRIGHSGDSGESGDANGYFAFDCETPAHDVLLRPFAIASRVVTNGEWRAFIEDGGYRMAGLWLSDGWATVQREGWGHPLYWELHDGEWQSMTLAGMQPVDDNAPVRHVSYFEADAFARWAGKRLPTEQEWEVAASAASPTQHAMTQCYGPVWQWTASPYVAYPGFRTAAGAVGEYNGKFMCGQFVLRGGSLATPPGHARATYRNFFYPHQRWQFCGLRLAEDR